MDVGCEPVCVGPCSRNINQLFFCCQRIVVLSASTSLGAPSQLHCNLFEQVASNLSLLDKICYRRRVHGVLTMHEATHMHMVNICPLA